MQLPLCSLSWNRRRNHSPKKPNSPVLRMDSLASSIGLVLHCCFRKWSRVGITLPTPDMNRNWRERSESKVQVIMSLFTGQQHGSYPFLSNLCDNFYRQRTLTNDAGIGHIHSDEEFTEWCSSKLPNWQTFCYKIMQQKDSYWTWIVHVTTSPLLGFTPQCYQISWEFVVHPLPSTFSGR